MFTHTNQEENRIRRVTELERGEAAFVPTHAAWVQNGRMYLNGEYPIHSVGGGSFGIRLIRDAGGVLKVDLSGVLKPNFAGFSSFASFGGQVLPVVVDEALELPRPDPQGNRIVDMLAYEVAYIDPSDVWVYQDKRMWLNGYTRTQPVADAFRCLKLIKDADGSISVDLRFCDDFDWATAADDSVEQFPIQVLKRVG